MKIARRAPRWLTWIALAFFVMAFAALAPGLALARSGSSFGGRQGFRSGGGMSMPSSPGYSSPGYSGGGYGRSYYGGGSHFMFFPSFGGYGFGGGLGFFAPLLGLMVAGLVIASIARAVRASRGVGASRAGAWNDDDAQVVAMPGRAYLYKVQLALGRSARGIQDRLADFAAQGDTGSESGLTALLQQTALELLREKDAIRYASGEARGPMSLTNAETAMNGVALSERSRFQVERLRSVDGHLSRSTAVAEEGKEVLELVVVTLIVATRVPLDKVGAINSGEELSAALSELGGVSPDGMLGLEVVWTPADPDDSMTEMDVMTTYPDLRGL
jgi:uncharacterized membrane protein